jgi:single-stranded-DNA-specific exonuclease
MLRRPIRRREVPERALAPSLHPVLARVYAARGVASSEDLEVGLDRLLPVGSLDGVDAAAELIDHHLGRGSPIVVVGDFDCDGATASAIVVRALTGLGHAATSFLVPDRFRYGYGLTPPIVDLAAARRPGLLITVDNGVSSVAGVARARELGVDVLVTDHHLPGPELPDATAIVNPNLPGSRFASRALAGCGVAFYVMAALAKRRGASAAQVAGLLDLVALGAGDLGFFLGPRLNAAGRLDDMSIGIECLLTDDAARARELAHELDRLNSERRTIEARMQDEALEIVRRMRFAEPGARLPAGVCLFDGGWHQGVVGLVASRVKEQAEEGSVRGSARSVPGVHVRDVIEAIATREPGLLEKFGGHAMAAGMTLPEANLARFSQAFAEEVGRRADPASLEGVLLTDGALAAPEFSLATAEQLREGGPWGQAFPEPSFDGEFAVVESRTLGDRHLKLWVRPDAHAPPIEAIAFGWLARGGADVPRANGRTHLVYRLDVNEYQGLRRPQLVVDYLEAR